MADQKCENEATEAIDVDRFTHCRGDEAAQREPLPPLRNSFSICHTYPSSFSSKTTPILVIKRNFFAETLKTS